MDGHQSKKRRVQLHTFENWGVCSQIGHTKDTNENRCFVESVWCKLCAKHHTDIIRSRSLRGKALVDFEKYVVGTTFVTKHTVNRHLESLSHKAAVQFERLSTKANETVVQNPENGNREEDHVEPVQPRINYALNNQATDAYKKVFNTAFILAEEGLPLKIFETLIRIQKANGVQLIDGTDSSNAAKKIIHELSNSMREKISDIIKTSNFITLLSDGSQARKTGSEKELVLIRTVHNSLPSNYIVSLQNIDDFGDATSEVIKQAIDDVFVNKLKINRQDYTHKLIAATADGAAVNTGIYNGLLTRLKAEDREWLVAVHCICHRVELAVKDSLMKVKLFKDVEDLLIGLYYLFKKSGKFKRHFEQTGFINNVTVYKFPKISGTRFVSHHKRGVGVLLHNWVILLQAIDNSIANKKYSAINSKLLGYKKKLVDFNFLASCCLYKRLLDEVSILSLQFQKSDVFVFEVLDVITKITQSLNDIKDNDSFKCAKTFVKETSGITIDDNTYKVHLLATGHSNRKAENRELVEIDFSGVHCNIDAANSVIQKLEPVIKSLIDCIQTRFDSFNQDIFKNMFWLNPANWGDTTKELASLEYLVNQFEVPLKYADPDVSFDSLRIKKEWRELNSIVNTYYSSFSALQLWSKILMFRSEQFPAICIIVELLLSIGITNSIVESGFSHLNAMLCDNRLRLSHTTMEDLLLIKSNRNVFSSQEKENINNNALEIYLKSRRKLKMNSLNTSAILGKRKAPPPQIVLNAEPDSDLPDVVITSSSDSDSESSISTHSNSDFEVDI